MSVSDVTLKLKVETKAADIKRDVSQRNMSLK
jgi:hypothetical protein